MRTRGTIGRSRIALILGTIAVLTLAGEALAGAKPFVATLKDNVCTHTGAFYGYGTVDTTARMTENGRNGTNYMAIKSKFQKWSGGSWQTLAGFGPYKSAEFRNGAGSHTHSQIFAWAFRDIDLGGTFRWKVTFQWWDKRSGPDVKVAEKVRTSPTCTA